MNDEYITILKEEIKTLKDMLHLKDSEIAKYQEVLRDIGADLKHADHKLAPQYSRFLDEDYYEPVELHTVTVDYHVKFGRRKDLEARLKKIREVLEEYDKF